MATTKKLASLLDKRGPHKVLRGDLALAGQPGVVYTPAEGFSLPGVAFAHGWTLRTARYTKTLEHLASWGIVAAAPDTERGLLPSHRGLATDLSTVLDIMTGVRLGSGAISVHPDKLAVAGHGMGAGAAVLTASQRPDVKAVAALFPAPTTPRADHIAQTLDTPGLIVTDGGLTDSLSDNSMALAGEWRGPAVLRRIDGSKADGLAEGRRFLGAVGLGGSEKKTQRTTRVLLTAFLLFHLTGDDSYEELAGEAAELKGTHVIDPHAPMIEQPRPSAITGVKALLGR